MEEFLLNNPDSEYFKEALEFVVRLKDKADTIPWQSTYPTYFERNAITIILENDSIPYLEMELIDLEYIDHYVFDYLQNPKDNMSMSEKRIVELNSGNQIAISKCHIYVVVKNSIDLKIVRRVTKLLSNALKRYKISIYNQLYSGSEIPPNSEIGKIINTELKNRIRFYKYNKFLNRYPFMEYKPVPF